MIINTSPALTNDTTNGVWLYQQTANTNETHSTILTTENTFIDKNIVIRTVVPAASGSSLSITDKTSEVSIGTASGGYYPLSTSLTGNVAFSQAGWVSTGNISLTDESVTVGKILQSTLSNGDTPISSGAQITPGATDQTINISAGYNGARTIVVKAASSSSPAAASVVASGTATQPTLDNTATSLTGKTQVEISPVTASSSVTGAYFVAMTATAPATTPTLTPSVSTAGYLGNASQISTSGSINSSTRLYYASLDSAAISIGGNVTVNPTATKVTKSVSGKTQILSDVTPNADASGISTYYVALNINAPATNITLNKSNFSAGYLGDDSQVTLSNSSTTAKTNVYYVPVPTAVLSAGSTSISAVGSSVIIDAGSTTQPGSGRYIAVTSDGSTGVSTAGWAPTTATATSTSLTKYYTVQSGSVTQNQATGTITITEGYVSANSLNINRGSIATSASSGVTYTENTTAVLNEQGYLYINAGYIPNTKISLATLIPDDSTLTNAGNSHILQNYEAYDTNGVKLVGSIPTYQGAFTTAS